ncbi:hypothetical protein IDJ77_26840 [Mucilaginibacter sp. ZT4R22]|uniref:Uncharacterized protein n=1 Tax=Mucilaginibacter pankratovii TaxID=2772110 RepID=A0ABR7X1Q2_9SPHI|nr:hypothetical protein [Mucilaginibacter pankratovii]MBD1367457.1 hypothetical protein [Mucilaginibacter pankratovii]
MKTKLFLLTAAICCTAIGSVKSQKAQPNVVQWYTWDTALCYKETSTGTTMYSRCVTPATDGPCITQQSCPPGSETGGF